MIIHGWCNGHAGFIQGYCLFVFYGVFGVWVYLNVDLVFIYAYFGYMFLSISCLCPTYVREPRGFTLHFAIDFDQLFRADDARELLLLMFAVFSNTTLIIIKERNRSWSKKCFTLLRFFETLNSQEKGLGFIDSFVYILIAFNYNLLVDYSAFI